MGCIKGIIFDMDGTLVDSIQDIMASMNYVLRNNNLKEHELSEYRSYIGNGVTKLVERSTGHIGDDIFYKVREEYSAYYNGHSSINTKAFDHMEETLKILSHQYKLAVLSNKGDSDIKILVPSYFRSVKFDAMYGQFGSYKVKPDPQLALYTAKQLNICPENILFVGDSSEDIMTGKNAGMKTAGVLWGYRNKNQLQEAGCSNFCAQPSDLIKLVEEL